MTLTPLLYLEQDGFLCTVMNICLLLHAPTLCHRVVHCQALAGKLMSGTYMLYDAQRAGTSMKHYELFQDIATRPSAPICTGLDSGLLILPCSSTYMSK